MAFGFGDSNKDAGPKIYKATQPLNFKNNHYTLYECDTEHLSGKNYYIFVRALNFFCWANVCKNIYRMRLFRTLLWGIPTFLSHLAVSGFKEHTSHFITKMELLDDGKRAEITFLSGKRETVNATDIK